MAGSGRRIVIEFLGRDSGFGDAADDAARKSSRLGDTLKTVGKVGAIALAAGAAVAGKALWDMTKAAIEDQKSQATLAQALKNTAGATDAQVAGVEDWISAQGEAFGVADDKLRPALERLSRATGDVSEAQKLASLAMDISAGTGKDLQTVSEALGRAADGNTGALSRLGVKTKNAAGETLSFKDVTKQLSDTFKGQARTSAETLEGKMDRLRLMFDEAKESIGARLIPVVTRLADWMLNKMVPAISDVWSWLQEKLGPAVSAVADYIQRLVARFQEGGGGADRLKQAFKDLQPFIKLVGTVIENVVWPALKKLFDVAVPAAIEQFRFLAKMLGTVGKAAIGLWNNFFAPMVRFILNGIGRLLDGWGDMLAKLGKIPGFGWARDAADKLRNAADKARSLADNVRAIPDRKRVDVEIVQKFRSVGMNFIDNGHNGPVLPRAMTGGAGANGRSLIPRSTLSPRAAAIAGGGGVTVNINAPIDSVSAGREVRRVLNAYERTMGGRQVVM